MRHPMSLRSVLMLGVALPALLAGPARAQQAGESSSILLDTISVETQGQKESPTGPVQAMWPARP